MFRLLVASCLITVAYGHSLTFGRCPSVTVDPINVRKMAGVWYVQSRSGTDENNSLTCSKVIWSKPVAGVSKITLTSYSKTLKTNSTILADGFLNEGKLGINYHVPSDEELYNEYTIIDADYSNHYVLWGCKNYGFMHTITIWYLSREIQPTFNIHEIAEEVLEEKGLQALPMVAVDHTNCA